MSDIQSLQSIGLASSLNYAIFGFAGMIANAALLVALFRIRKEKSPFNKTLASLAVANFISDVFFAINGTMFSYDITAGNYKFERWNNVSHLLSFNNGAIAVALSHIVFIAIQRFVAVHFPLRFRRIFTTKLSSFYISLTWIAATALILIFWFVDAKNIVSKDILASYSILIFGFILIVCYTWILTTLRIRRRISRRLGRRDNATSDTFHCLNLLLNSVGVTLLFLILVCPYAISSLKGDNFILRQLLSSLIPIRTVTDPMIYFFISLCIKCPRHLEVQNRNANNLPNELERNNTAMVPS